VNRWLAFCGSTYFGRTSRFSSDSDVMMFWPWVKNWFFGAPLITPSYFIGLIYVAILYFVLCGWGKYAPF
jgi:membrane-bound metal-dependent hydrolase YbcI (DUF457 family)